VGNSGYSLCILACNKSDYLPPFNGLYNLFCLLTFNFHFVKMHNFLIAVQECILYKLCLLVYLTHSGQASQCLTDCMSAVSTAGGSYRLRSTESVDYVLPRTRTKFRGRGLCFSSPAAWNVLCLIYIMSLALIHSKTAQECTFWLFISMTIVWCSRTLHRAVPYKFHFELEVTDWLAFVLLLLLLCLLGHCCLGIGFGIWLSCFPSGFHTMW